MRCVPGLFLPLALCLSACGPDPARATPDNALSAEEMALEAPAGSAVPESTPEVLPPSFEDGNFFNQELSPVDVDEAQGLQLRILSETAYLDAQGGYMLDLFERDMAYLTLVIETAEGRPVRNARPSYAVDGSSRVVPMSAEPITDDTGWIQFGVIGGKMGSERLTVTVGDERVEVGLNVISLEAAGYAKLDDSQGGLRWEALMQARLSFDEEGVAGAEIPPDIAAQDGQTVKLIGFMMPLEAEQKQKHFLLTSNPPNCFFHIPGGPAGAVEVFSESGIEASWDPVLLEGRFETVQRSEVGVIYRLHQARVIEQ